MTKTSRLARCAALVLCATATRADTLVVATGHLGLNTNTIYAVDVETGIGTRLFPVAWSVLGMTADDTGRIWFTAEDGGLYTFRLGDQAPTFVGMLTRSALTSNLRMDGLAFTGGVLYGWQEFADVLSGEPAGLYSIDTSAVTRTLVHPAPDGDLRSGFDADPQSGLMLLANDMQLCFEVYDPGEGTLVPLRPYPAGESDIDGLAVGGGFLWTVEDDPAPGRGNPPGQIYKIDLQNGALLSSFDVPWSGQGLFAAGAYVTGCHPPVVVGRNAGTNPSGYDCYAVVVDGVFQATVDVAGAGQLCSRIFALDSPAVVPLSGGQTLLALDLLGSGEYFNGAGISPTSSAGGVDGYLFPVPPDPLLCNFPIYTQAVLFGNAPFQLSNAQDVTIGG